MSETSPPNLSRSPTLTAFLLALLVLVFVGGLTSLAKQKEPAPEIELPLEEKFPSVEKDTAPAETPEALVSAFCESFFTAALPERDPNGPEAETARAFLTQAAQATVDKADPSSIVNGLLRFAAVESVPDQGFRLGQIDTSFDQATIETAWIYSDNTVPKTFLLSKGDSGWQISAIE